MRNGAWYRGPTLPTPEDAERDLAAAITKLDAGELPAVAHPRWPPPEGTDATAALPTARERAKTIRPVQKLTRDERKELESYPDDVDRPSTRKECEAMPRPCPFVSCAHHLFLDVNPRTGAIKLNFPALQPWEMRESCSLDVADRGGITLEEVGAIVNLTRERIRQVEVRGLYQIKSRANGELGVPPGRG
jgi:hypothetical protein